MLPHVHTFWTCFWHLTTVFFEGIPGSKTCSINPSLCYSRFNTSRGTNTSNTIILFRLLSPLFKIVRVANLPVRVWVIFKTLLGEEGPKKRPKFSLSRKSEQVSLFCLFISFLQRLLNWKKKTKKPSCVKEFHFKQTPPWLIAALGEWISAFLWAIGLFLSQWILCTL